MEQSLSSIIKDPNLSDESKAEMLYSTSLSVASHTNEPPLTPENIDRTRNIARSTVHLILNCKNSFTHLMNISCNDFYTATHSVNVSILLIKVAWHVGITDDAVLENIGIGGMLHDIGKMYLPQEILNKKEKLTEKEDKLYKQHVALTLKHLKKAGINDQVIFDVATMHHERLDGSGYPRKLKGNQITLTGKISSVVNTYEAMNTVRLDLDKRPSGKEIITYLRENKHQYDQNIVNMLETIVVPTFLDDGDSTDKPVNQDSVDIYDARIFGADSKRLHKRHDFRTMLEVRTITRPINKKPALSPPTKYIVFNSSISGAAILSPSPFSINIDICISFPIINSDMKKNIIAKTVRCQAHQNGLYTVGVNFYVTQNKPFFEMLKTL